MVARDTRIEVIATRRSGSIRDWGKLARVKPLFLEQGWTGVRLTAVPGHVEARAVASQLAADGARVIISAGGSGTFNAVVEGCCDSGVPLTEIHLGFLRKGSADLIGKVLEMPDQVEAAVKTFSDSIESDRTTSCDLLQVKTPGEAPRHFVGYGGAELFGRIPHFTENRFMKWYKGVLGQVFGDLGPFTIGMALAILESFLKAPFTSAREWRVTIDGSERATGHYRALILVNGYLGPDLAFSSDPLGSGRFHLFAIRDLGAHRLPGQVKAARGGDIAVDPERWGMEHYIATETLALDCGRDFPLNVDGSTVIASGVASVERVGELHLISAR